MLKNKWFSCLIVAILVPLLLLVGIGEEMVVKAAQLTDFHLKKEIRDPNIGELPNQRPQKRIELKAQRSRYSTRFFNTDGSFTEEIYLKPKYYLDTADRQWKEIKTGILSIANQKGRFENRTNGFHSSFNPAVSKDGITVLKKGDTHISFLPIGADKVNGVVQKNKIKYKNIFPGININYQINGRGLKEEIVINQYINKNTFTFELKLKNLKAIQEKETIFLVNNKDQKIWYISKPFMRDDEGRKSEKVELYLTKKDDKTYLHIIADEKYLTDPKTEYPVVIDPTINTWDVMRDNFIASNFSDNVYKSSVNMYTGNDEYYYGIMRSLVQFFLPSLPSSSQITSANFNAYQTYDVDTTVSIDLFRITEYWTDNVTWNNQPSIATSPTATETNSSSAQYWQWEITQLVRDWYSGKYANYGFMLKHRDENELWRRFNTTNSQSNTPRLTINYQVDAIGIEEFWGYSEDGVNLANGNLVFQGSDFLIPGRGPSLSLKRTYNSRASEQSGIFGYGWISNLETKIIDSGRGPITLVDGDGTHHYFGQKYGGGYETAGGLYLDLEKNTDGTYTITRSNADTNKFQDKLHFNTAGRISSIEGSDGNLTTFNYQDSRLVSINDSSNRTVLFTYNSDNYIVGVQLPGGRSISYNYDQNGNLQQVRGPEGNSIKFTYNLEHNLTTITDRRSIETTINYDGFDRVDSIARPITIDGYKEESINSYTYDVDNNLTTVVDGEGRRIDYNYNQNGNITKVIKAPLDPELKAVTTYNYDDNNNLVEKKEANTNQTDSEAAYVYTYDIYGNLTQLQLPENQLAGFGFDDNNNLIVTSDFKDYEDYYQYDINNNQQEDIDSLLQSMAARFKENGNLSYHTKPLSPGDNLLLNPSFEFDSDDPDNRPDYWDVELEGSGVATVGQAPGGPAGDIYLRMYSAEVGVNFNSTPISHQPGTVYALSGWMRSEDVTSLTDLRLQEFDSNMQLVQEHTIYRLTGSQNWIRAKGLITDLDPDTAYIRISLHLGATEGIASFDGLQLEPISTVSNYNFVENAGFELDLNEDGVPDRWETSDNLGYYDGIETDPDNVYAQQRSYRLKGETGKVKYIKEHIEMGGTPETKLTISGWSKQLGASEAGGKYGIQVKINYWYGNVGWSDLKSFSASEAGWQHIVAEINPTYNFNSFDVYYYYSDQSGTAWFDAMRLERNSAITSYSYDSGGNYVTEIKDPFENITSFGYDEIGNLLSYTDPLNNTTSYQYDQRNLMTQIIDARQNETNYSYDDTGNLISVTDAKNNVTEYQYNEYNAIAQITDPLDRSTLFDYDKSGNRVGTLFANGNQVNYGYNKLNRLTQIDYGGVTRWDLTYDRTGNLITVTDNTGQTTNYSYDHNSRLIKQKESTGEVLDYGYDANGNITEIRATASTDQVSFYKYNQLDQLEAINFWNTDVIKMAYNERGSLVSKVSGPIFANYTYDAAGRLSSMRINRDDGSLYEDYSYGYDANDNRISTTSTSGTRTYQYDELNRLTQEEREDGTTVTYQYDSAGNRTQKTVITENNTEVTNYSYDEANQLIEVNGVPYSYDDNGNLISTGEQEYIYDARNRLIEVKDKTTGQRIATFTYDHQGKRESKTTSDGTIYYYYDTNGRLIYDTDENHNLLNLYTYDSQGNPLSVNFDGYYYLYQVSGHGDVTRVTTPFGDVVAEYEYDAWGNIIYEYETTSEINPFRYAGYIYDEETDLYYLNSRYYDPKLGRFLTKDTVPKINHYVYAQNNPVNYVDPSGHYVIPQLNPTIQYTQNIGLIRSSLSAGASQVLNRKGYNLAYQLFNQSLYGGGKTQFYDDDSLLSNKLSQSSNFRTQLKNEIGVRSAFRFKSSINFTDNIDLQLGIGKMKYTATGYKYGNKWKVSIYANDEYDFDGIRDWRPITLGNWANNFGLLSQNVGVIEPYEWSSYFEMNIE